MKTRTFPSTDRNGPAGLGAFRSGPIGRGASTSGDPAPSSSEEVAPADRCSTQHLPTRERGRGTLASCTRSASSPDTARALETASLSSSVT